MANKIYLVRSETWMGDDFEDVAKILEDTLHDYVGNDRVINIECKEKGGLSRFWIYAQETTPNNN